MTAVLALSSARVHAESRVINQRPDSFGIYLFRQGAFIPLEQTRLRYTNTWFTITYSNSRLAACHLPEVENDLKISAQYKGEDLLAIYFPEASDHQWYYSTLFHFSEVSFRGRASHDIHQRPEGWYAGFVAMGPRQDMVQILGETSDDYHFESKSIKKSDIVFQDKDIIFARVIPDSTLPVTKYIITAKDFTFNKDAKGAEIREKLPQNGYLVEFPEVAEVEYFQARQDLIRRYNDSRVKLYLVTHKEFVLNPDEIVHTGIFVDSRCRVRFRSTDDFRIVTEPGEWGEKAYWPLGFTFPRDYIHVREGAMKAHLVEHRNFSLRYEKTEAGTEVRLMGLKTGSKVMVIYSPLYAYDIEYEDHVEAGWTAFRSKDYAAALKEFQTALEIMPDYPKALSALSWLYANAEDPAFKNPAEALRLANRALLFHPQRPYVFDAASSACFVNGDLDGAIDNQEQAYGKWSTPPKSYVEKMAMFRELRAHKVDASKYFEAGRYTEAIKELQAVLAKMPNYFDALNLFAMILATAKDPNFRLPEMALKYAEAAYSLAPDRDYVLDTVAEALYANNQKDLALQFAQKALYYDLANEHYREQVKRFSE